MVEQYGAIHAPQGRLEVNGGDIVVGGDANVKDLVIEADGSAIFTADTSDDLDRFRMLAGGLATVAAPVDATSASVRGNDVITVATMDIEKHLVLDAENQAVISASVT